MTTCIETTRRTTATCEACGVQDVLETRTLADAFRVWRSIGWTFARYAGEYAARCPEHAGQALPYLGR